MDRPRHDGSRPYGERPTRDWLGGYRLRLRATSKPRAVWAGLDKPRPAPYLAPTLEQEMVDLAGARPGPQAGVIFGYAGRDAAGPFVVAVRVLPFSQVEPLEGGVRVPRPSWWELSLKWQQELPELEPVGWFRIQPGQGTQLGSYDRFTAYQRFADPLQFSWVLDPERGRQALYAWEGSELVALPGYWRCTEPPVIPPRVTLKQRPAAATARRVGVLATLAALKPWLVAAAGATALYLLLPFAPGSLTSRLRPAPAAPEVFPTSPAGEHQAASPIVAGGATGAALLDAGGEQDAWAAQAGGQARSPAPPAPADQPSLREGSGSGAPSSNVAYISYQVGRGETLWSISLRLLGDPTRYREIAALNGITDPSRLQAGQILIIPIDLEGALK